MFGFFRKQFSFFSKERKRSSTTKRQFNRNVVLATVVDYHLQHHRGVGENVDLSSCHIEYTGGDKCVVAVTSYSASEQRAKFYDFNLDTGEINEHIGEVMLPVSSVAPLPAARTTPKASSSPVTTTGEPEQEKLKAEFDTLKKPPNPRAIIVASQNGDVGVVTRLLADGANVNGATNDGATTLYLASQEGHVEVVKLLLLQGGTDVNAASKAGSTPLYVASEVGFAEVVVLLLAAGANVNAAANEGATPLIIACANGHAEIVKRLLAAGANVNAVNKDGDTSQKVASRYGHAAVTQLLKAV